MRCSPFGTKLRISSFAISRRTSLSASLKSCLRPRGARLENACARCKHICGSNSSHTDLQYCAVDSITASSTPSCLSHVDKRRNSPGMVVNRRRSGFDSGVRASIITTIKTFLCTSIPAILSAIVTSRRGSGRKRAQRHQTPSRATNHPSRIDGATRIGSNTHPRPNSSSASTHPE
ncbi:MAG: hypothetical protein QOE55_3617 [Acidobacteriaceae bacterium]|nr:hypothetical protein [Acidobacteriaceae bacterium]